MLSFVRVDPLTLSPHRSKTVTKIISKSKFGGLFDFTVCSSSSEEVRAGTEAEATEEYLFMGWLPIACSALASQSKAACPGAAPNLMCAGLPLVGVPKASLMRASSQLRVLLPR